MKKYVKKIIKFIKKYKLYLIVFLVLVALIICILILNKPHVADVINRKVIYDDRIIDVNKWYDGNIVIEYMNDYDNIDNCVITKDSYEMLKNGDYDIKISEYLRNASDNEAKDINAMIKEKIITENTKYSKYLALTCGFKNKRKLLRYTESVFDYVS